MDEPKIYYALMRFRLSKPGAEALPGDALRCPGDIRPEDVPLLLHAVFPRIGVNPPPKTRSAEAAVKADAPPKPVSMSHGAPHAQAGAKSKSKSLPGK